MHEGLRSPFSLGSDRFGLVVCGSALARHGSVRHGKAWFGSETPMTTDG